MKRPVDPYGKPWPPIPSREALVRRALIDAEPARLSYSVKVDSLEEGRRLARERGERGTFVDGVTGARHDVGADGNDVIDVEPQSVLSVEALQRMYDQLEHLLKKPGGR